MEKSFLGISHPGELKEWTMGYKVGRLTGDEIAMAVGRFEFLAGTGMVLED